MNAFRFAALFLCASSFASAVTVTLGPSFQTVTFVAGGSLQSGTSVGTLHWGSCAFDGTNTQCHVAGPYTVLGAGGTYDFLFSYLGNGPSPLVGISTDAGSNYFDVEIPVDGSYFVFSLTPTDGTQRTFAQIQSDISQYVDSLSFTPPTCTRVSTCSVVAVGATPAATISGPVSGLFDVTPRVKKVISAGSFGAFSTVAPGTWVEIYGLNLGTISSILSQSKIWTGADFNGTQAPTSLGETSVTIGGLTAYVEYVSPSQVNVQIPSGVSPGDQPLVVMTFGGASVATTVKVNATSPGLLVQTSFRVPEGQYAGALFPDGVTFALPPGTIAGVPQRRAKVGDTITLYGIGFGPVTPNIDAGLIEQQANSLPGLQISFAGVTADIRFAGLVQGLVGLYQFNVVVPNVAVSDTVPVRFKLNGTAGTQALLVPVGN